jgi:N-acyl-D-amino-acid deacylase
MRAAVILAFTLVATSTTASQTPAPTAAGLLIKGGTVIDGTGAPRRVADVRTSGDAIVEVGANLAPSTGEKVIDAAGRVVTPGFIDMHSHADRGLEDHPDAESQVRQGITLSLVGQDGGGDLPISDFFERFSRVHPAINVMTSVGHGAVRGVVLGGDFKRPATAAEIETMKALVDRAMKDGAVGLSSGLEYDPGFYGTIDELAALASVIKPYGGFYSSHVRDEEDEVLAAWSEAIEIGRRAGVPVEISHMKLASKPVWGHSAKALGLVDAARKAGQDVTGDWYPYQYWQSSMYVLIPDRNFDNVAEWQKGLEEIGGAQNVLITNYRLDPTWDGHTLAELAAQQQMDPAALIVQMVKAAGPEIGIIGTAMTEEDMAAIFASPATLICSDGGLSGRHPRGYGAFPRVLARYVRERKILPLEEAVAKMTGRSAKRLGLTDRGVLSAGHKADLVIFDPAAIADRGTPAEPAQAPVGIDVVVVNGEVVLDHGVETAARPGRALKRGGV